jgi:hypothetical protein
MWGVGGCSFGFVAFDPVKPKRTTSSRHPFLFFLSGFFSKREFGEDDNQFLCCIFEFGLEF